MNALIILAHGSRREESNIEIKNLANKVKELAGSEYNIIDYAYLEIAKPSLLNCIDNLIKEGTKNINVLPYFLNSGIHVTKDIPKIIETASIKYPDCHFKVSNCIGLTEEMPATILNHARL